jgi:beta-carotene ketolase (CrtO type)
MEEVYDIVIVGGGMNSISTAAYLSKCGLSVCICEARNECGGGAENVEPMPGYRIDPHATYLYGGAAPAFEQLELHKFGFRFINYQGGGGIVLEDGRGLHLNTFDPEGSIKSIAKFSKSDAETLGMLLENLWGNQETLCNFLRSIYWTPPPPEHIKLSGDDLPWAGVINEVLPGMYSDEWNHMSMSELNDVLLEFEPFKVSWEMGTWYNGPHPQWKGTAIPGMACNLLAFYSQGSPMGGMHAYAHSIIRCAMHYGTRIYTRSKVEEIIIEGGEAKGVRLADDAAAKNKKIYARKAVLSNTHVMPTFLELVPSSSLEPDFVERVKGINIKGGSLFVLSLVTKEMPVFKDKATNEEFDKGWPTCIMIGADRREAMDNHERVVYGENTHPIKQEDLVVPLCFHDMYDKTRCTVDGHYLISPIYIQVPPPEDHVDGPEAVNNAKDEIVDAILTKIRGVAPNLTEDKIVAKFVNTPYDSELRNMGFVGSNWMGISQEEEQWYEKKPLPELSRYRTPIKNLYLCHQSSYPGGLALQAVSYNLMHILIEDLDLKPGDWWYPSPHWIPSDA